MKMIKTLIMALVVGLIAGLSSACTSPLPGEVSARNGDNGVVAGPALSLPLYRSRVALDLVNALVQVQGFTPGEINVDVSRLQGPFGDSLKRALAAKGYRSRRTPAADDVRVQFRARRGSQADLTTVIFSAGSIKLKRDYRLENGGVQPASLMFIRGAPADMIEPDDSIFFNASASSTCDPANKNCRLEA